MMNKRKQSYGFSLVELMVAMVVGLIVITGAFSLHTGSRKTQKVNEMQMDMVADARFAIEMISYDLRHSGMWGGTNKANLIDCKSTNGTPCVQTATNDVPPTAMVNDCQVGWYYDLSQPVFATNDLNPYPTTCIPTTEAYKKDTDVIEIRYADSNTAPKLLPNQAYIRSNFVNGRIFIGPPQPLLDSYDDSDVTQNHELHAYVYYVSDFTDDPKDGIPSLRRLSLINAPSLQTQTLISGVDDLQIMFGVDLDKDQKVDRYDHPNNITTDGNWDNVYAAKIWLMMRSDKKQKGINTAKDFSMAGTLPAKTYGGQDDYRYFMVTSVVNLRNLVKL